MIVIIVCMCVCECVSDCSKHQVPQLYPYLCDHIIVYTLFFHLPLVRAELFAVFTLFCWRYGSVIVVNFCIATRCDDGKAFAYIRIQLSDSNSM